MNAEELTPHIEELKKVLENKVSEEEIVKELDRYLNVFHVDINMAMRGIKKKYGVADDSMGGAGGSFVTGSAVSKKIGNLSGTEQNVDILAKVVFAEKRNVQIKGSPRTIVSGILGDETATASFTVWDGENCELEKGAVYTFKNAYTKLWNDKVQINMGSRGVIQREDKDIAMPDRQISYSSSIAKVADLKEGIGNVTVTVKVMSIEARNITVRGEPRVVYSGIMADETGKVQFSAWADFDLKQGETVCIKNAYIRGWKGIPQLNFGDKADVSRVDDNFGNLDDSASEKTIGDIVKNGGGIDISVSGTVVDLRSGSGLIKRCPMCNRSVLSNECLTHGTIEPVPDLRMKIVVDDGTGAISAIVNKELTEKLTGISLNMAVDMAKARGESEVIARSMAERILVKHITITGNVMCDEYGPSMIVKAAELDTVDVPGEAAELLKKVEEVLM